MSRKYTAIVVSHTHWNRAWSSPFQQSRMRLVRLVDGLIQILNDDPGYESFTFDGQTIILEDYLEIRPEMERELRRLIQNGRILVGPWYVPPDEFLISAEAMVRNLMIGHMVAEKFGAVMKIGYVPDAFGHISQLPQILRGFDIDSAIFTRGMGDEGEKLGSEFLWYASDGESRALAVHQISGYCNAVDLMYDHWGRADLGNAVENCRSLIHGMKPYASTGNLLLNDGCDFAEPQPEVPDIIEYVNSETNDMELIHGAFADYLELVRAKNPKLKKYQGELRGSRYHSLPSGVFSSRIYMKQANESAQTLMERWAEPFSALDWLETGNPYPRSFLWYAWKELIKNHSHSDICGCGFDEVHRDDMTRYSWVQQVGEGLTIEALESLSSNINTQEAVLHGHGKNSTGPQILRVGSPRWACFVIFNPLPWARLDSISFAAPESSILEDTVLRNADGEAAPTQVIPWDEDQIALTFLARVPALGYATYFVSPCSDEERFAPCAEIRPRTMENKFFRVKINPNGSLNILDKSNGVEYRGCNIYEDKEDAGDEYDYSPIKGGRAITSRSAKAHVKIIENGPVKATAEIKLSMNLPKGLTKDRTSRASATFSCPITTLVTIYADVPRIDFVTIFENKVEDHRLRVLFPTGIEADVVNVEGHFDVLARPVDLPKPKGKWAQDPAPTDHQNAFVDVSDGEKGFALINKGLPEYEVRKTKGGNTIYLTLLRCVGWLSRGDLLTRRDDAGVNIPTPEAQCPGTHTFMYSVFPHAGDWVSAQVQRRAHEHNVPMKAAATSFHEGPLPAAQSFVSVEPHDLMVTALKKCELGDGLILRLYNSTAETVNGVIKAHRPVKSACLTNLNEQPLSDGEIDINEDGYVSLEVGGGEIKTTKLGF